MIDFNDSPIPNGGNETPQVLPIDCVNFSSSGAPLVCRNWELAGLCSNKIHAAVASEKASLELELELNRLWSYFYTGVG